MYVDEQQAQAAMAEAMAVVHSDDLPGQEVRTCVRCMWRQALANHQRAG